MKVSRTQVNHVGSPCCKWTKLVNGAAVWLGSRLVVPSMCARAFGHVEIMGSLVSLLEVSRFFTCLGHILNGHPKSAGLLVGKNQSKPWCCYIVECFFWQGTKFIRQLCMCFKLIFLSKVLVNFLPSMRLYTTDDPRIFHPGLRRQYPYHKQRSWSPQYMCTLAPSLGSWEDILVIFVHFQIFIGCTCTPWSILKWFARDLLLDLTVVRGFSWRFSGCRKKWL